MNFKQFAVENARTQAGTLKTLPRRAGNTIDWFRCSCGQESNLTWLYGDNTSHILACSLDCAVAKAKAQVKLGFFNP